MATIIQQSELARRAIIFISEKISEKPDARLADLLDEAGMRFNLSPLEAAWLERELLKRCSRQD